MPLLIDEGKPFRPPKPPKRREPVAKAPVRPTPTPTPRVEPTPTPTPRAEPIPVVPTPMPTPVGPDKEALQKERRAEQRAEQEMAQQKAWVDIINQRFEQFRLEALSAMTSHATTKGWDLRKTPSLSDKFLETLPYFIDEGGLLHFSMESPSLLKDVADLDRRLAVATEKNPPVWHVFEGLRQLALAGKLDPLRFFLDTENALGYYNFQFDEKGKPKQDELGYSIPDPKTFKQELSVEDLNWGAWKDAIFGGIEPVGWLGPLENNPAVGAAILAASFLPQIKGLTLAPKIVGAGQKVVSLAAKADLISAAITGQPIHETSTAKAIGALRQTEHTYVGDPIVGWAEKLDIPIIDVPDNLKQMASDVLLPSNLLLIHRLTMMSPTVAVLASKAAGPLASQAARLGAEGAIFFPMDITTNAWAEGRDPTAKELLVAMGLGAGTGAAFGAGMTGAGLVTGAVLPFVAKAAGATLIRMPGGRYLMRIRGQQYRTAPQIIQDLILRQNQIPVDAVKNLDKLMQAVPIKLGGVLGIGPKTKYFVHVTPDTQLRSIADGGIPPSEANPLREASGGVHAFDAKNFDMGWKAYGDVIQRLTPDTDPNGIVLALHDDAKLISDQSKQYLGMVKANRDATGAINWDAVRRDVLAAGFKGIATRSKVAGKILEEVNLLDDTAYDMVSRVVPNLQRAAERAPQVMGRKVITPTSLDEMSFDELAAEFLTGGGGWLPPSIYNNWVDFFRKLAGLRTSPRFIMKGSQVSRYAHSYDDLLTDPRIVRLINEIPDAIDRDQFLWYLKKDWVPGVIPQGVNPLKWIQGIVTHAPGVRRVTQWLEIFTGRSFEEGNISANRKGAVLTFLLKKAFPKENLENPKLLVKGVTYVGPKRTAFQAEVTGTMADIIEHPDLYRGITPNMRRLAEVYTAVQDADANLMRLHGIDQQKIEGMYLAHRMADGTNSQIGAVASSLFQRTGRPIGRRLYRTVAEYNEVLRKHGFEAELDPLTLFIQRMAKGNQARAQATYANALAENYGRVLERGQRLHFGERLLPAELTGGRRIAVSEDIAAEVAEAGMIKRITPDVQNLEKVVDFFRGILLSADFSFFTIQGAALFSVDPARYLRNHGEMVAATSSREGFMMWTAMHSRELALASRSGLKFYASAIDLPVAGSPPALKLLAQGKYKEALSVFYDSPVQHLPVISIINDISFGRALPIAKLYAWRAGYEILRSVRDESILMRATGVGALKGVPVIGRRMGSVEKMFRELPWVDKAFRKLGGVEGATDFDLMVAAADTANNLGGGIDQFAVGHRTQLLEKSLLLTPTWIRANVGRLLMAGKVVDPRGVLARRALMHQLAIISVISTAASRASSGRIPSFDPRQTDWLDIKTPTGSIAIMPGKTYIRTLARLFGGVPWRDEKPWELTPGQLQARWDVARYFGEGRTGQLLRLGTDLKTGRDFLGRKIPNRLLYTAQSLSPIVIGEFMEAWQEGVRGVDLANRLWPEMMGLNVIPIRPTAQRNRHIIESARWRKSGEPFTGVNPDTGKTFYLTDYGQLSRAEKDEFDKWDASAAGPHINAQIDEEMERRASPFVVPDEIRLREQGDIQRLEEQFQRNWTQPGAALLYRRGLAEIRSTTRNQLDFFFQQQGTEPPEPTTTRQKVYQGYFEEVVDRSVDPTNKQMDTATFESLERAYFNFIEEEYGVLSLNELKADLNIHPTEGEVTTQWRRDNEVLEKGVWSLMDATFTPEYLEKFGGFEPARAEEIVRDNNSWEEFTRNWTSELLGSLIARPMPLEIGQLTSMVDMGDGQGRTEHTFYEIFRVRPDEPLTPQTAKEVAHDVATKIFKDFSTFRSEVRTGYLEENPEEICIMDLWEYEDTWNARLSPYLGLCPTNPFSSD